MFLTILRFLLREPTAREWLTVDRAALAGFTEAERYDAEGCAVRQTLRGHRVTCQA